VKAKAVMVRGNVVIPKTEHIYYFEMTVLNQGADGYAELTLFFKNFLRFFCFGSAIGIGLAKEGHLLDGMPGWQFGYGYHGDDGRAFSDGTGGAGKGMSLIGGPALTASAM
jgi:hypothetical protein